MFLVSFLVIYRQVAKSLGFKLSPFPQPVLFLFRRADGSSFPLQVTFKHVNDYVTYAWVKDDEISFSEDTNLVRQI